MTRERSPRGRLGLAWFDLYYQRVFQPVGDRLDFDTPAGGNGDVIYRIGPFTQRRRRPSSST